MEKRIPEEDQPAVFLQGYYSVTLGRELHASSLLNSSVGPL